MLPNRAISSALAAGASSKPINQHEIAAGVVNRRKQHRSLVRRQGSAVPRKLPELHNGRPSARSVLDEDYRGLLPRLADGNEVDAPVRHDEVPGVAQSIDNNRFFAALTGTRQIERAACPSRSTAIRRPVTRWGRARPVPSLGRVRLRSPASSTLQAPGPVRPEIDPVTVSRPSGPISSAGSSVRRRNSRVSPRSTYKSADPSRRESNRIVWPSGDHRGFAHSAPPMDVICTALEPSAFAIQISSHPNAWTQTSGAFRRASSRGLLVERRGEERHRNRPIGEAPRGSFQIALSLNGAEYTTRPDRATLTSIAPVQTPRALAARSACRSSSHRNPLEN